MANECIERYAHGQRVTCHVEATVQGCRFVNISDERISGNYAVSPCAAGAAAYGVAAKDAAAGSKVGVHVGNTVPVVAGATVVAGVEVEVGTSGRAITLASGRAVGKALTGGAADSLIDVRLY